MDKCFNKTVIICKHILHSCYTICFNNNNTISINNTNININNNVYNNNVDDDDNYNNYNNNDYNDDINCYCECIKKQIEIKANTLCLYTESFHNVNILLLALLSLLAFMYVYTCYNPTTRLHRLYPYPLRYNTLMISNDSNDSNNSNNNSTMNNSNRGSPYEMYDEYGNIIVLPPYDNNINTKNDNKTIYPPSYTI